MNLKDLYIYNKKTFWIVATIIVLALVLGIIFLNNRSTSQNENEEQNNYNMVLFGESEIILEKGSVYEEPGFYAINDSEIVTNDVRVSDNVDTSIPGTYEVTYIYKDIVKTRTIIVQKVEDEEQNLNEDKLNISLIGESVINLQIGDTYKEAGAKAYFNDLDISDKIIITGNVDTNSSGTYEIVYSINYNNQSNYVKRIVKVIDNLSISVSYDNKYTNQNIKANINITGDNFLYLKLPNNKIVTDKNYQYEISENGTYEFYAYDKNNKYEIETIKVTNIDKTNPNGTCKAEYNNNQTTINVTASDNLGIAYYVYSNEYKSTSNIYSINKKLTNVSVSIYDLAGNRGTISCNVTDKEASIYDYIEMHFIVASSDDDAILIRTKDKTVMIDGGRYKKDGKVVAGKITDYLTKIGVKKIDAMIGSHVTYNHVQAQAMILDKMEVSHAYYSVDVFTCEAKKQCEKGDSNYIADALKKHNTPTTILKAGDYLEIGEMKLYFIGPTRGKLTTYTNANSLVFILEYKGKKYMFTGDTPTKYLDIDKFTSYAKGLGTTIDVDFFKWPHHGIEKVPDSFFKATTPEFVLVPNYYGCSNLSKRSGGDSQMKRLGIKYYELCDGKDVILIGDSNSINMKKISNPSDYKR